MAEAAVPPPDSGPKSLVGNFQSPWRNAETQVRCRLRPGSPTTRIGLLMIGAIGALRARDSIVTRSANQAAASVRPESIWRVHKADGDRRRLESLQQGNEPSGFDRIGDEIGEPLSDADACARGIPRRSQIAYDEPRSDRHGMFGLTWLELFA